MSAPHRPSRWAQEEGINLTPLLDVIFNLIFFFILATSLREDNALDIRLPETKDAPRVVSEKQSITVLFTKEDKFFLEGDELSQEELVARITEKKAEIGEAFGGVSIEGDKTGNWDAAVQIFDAIQKSGVSQVKIKVNPPRGEPSE